MIVPALKADKEYWGSDFPLPLSPSDEDIILFKENMVPGMTLLLGCTKKLIPLSDRQMDIDPWYIAQTVIVQDWTTNTDDYDNIIGEGCLNFTKELADKVLIMCSKHSKVFIARTFNRKLDTMRIAAHFPKPQDFPIMPSKLISFKDYTFYIWKFRGKR